MPCLPPPEREPGLALAPLQLSRRPFDTQGRILLCGWDGAGRADALQDHEQHPWSPPAAYQEHLLSQHRIPSVS